MTTYAKTWRGGRAWVAAGGLLLMLAMLVIAAFVAAPPARSQGGESGRFLGVASCAGSTCHGRMEGDGTVVRQDELMKWQEPSTPGGAHSRAWAVLGNSRSIFIARNLGIGDPQKATMCIGCHSSTVASRGTASLDDGVSCETCHGPAGSWIASHYAGVGTNANPDAEMRSKHIANLSAGLRKLEDPVVRADVCVDCHFGAAGDGQFVTHRIMAAGHPRIAFELDLFSSLQAHHQEDDDYGWRKFGAGNARTDHVQMWAVGQAAAIERSLALFQSKRGSEGMFPEFYFLDCHSCHRRIFDQAKAVKTSVDNPGRNIPEGMPPYNDENLIMLAAAARVAAPGLADQLASRTAAFHRAIAIDRSSAVTAAAQLGQTVAALKSAFSSRSFSGTDAFTMVDAIASKAINDRFTDYSGSQQAVMGIDTLLNSMVSSGRVTVGGAAGIRADIDRAYAAVKDPNAYRPADFQASLGRAVRAIRALR